LPELNRTHLVIAISVISGLILNVDQSSIILVLGKISEQFDSSLSDSQWILSIYLLPLASLVIAGGAICDRYPVTHVLAGGFVLFLIGSIYSSVSQGLIHLLLARAICGVGAAAAFPASLALIRKCLPENLAQKAFGLWFAGALGGSAIGPLINGFLVDRSNWRIIFLISSVVSLLLLISLFFSHIPTPATSSDSQISINSSLATTIGLVGIVFGLIRAGSDGWLSPLTILPIAGGLIIFSSKTAINRFGKTNSRVSTNEIKKVWPFIGLMFLGILPVVGVVVLSVLYLGSIRELSVFQTGLAIAPFGLSAALLSPLVPKLLLKYKFTFMLSTAVLFQFSGLIILISTKSNSNYLTIGMGLFCLGISMAILPSSTLNQALTYVPDSLSGYISGLHNGAIQVGQLLSIALIGSLATANINKQLRKTFSSDWGNISDANYEALARGEDWLPSQLSNTEIETFRELARVGFSSGLSITVFTAMIILFTFVFFGLISKQKLSKSSI
tara:strand:- start:368 stop:1873 length:1506 start_codon:yes stop_codon:yes gene_type:complete